MATDDPISDGEIARAIIGGEAPSAEAELVVRFSRRVFLFGMRHLADESRAEDLAQEVMATVLLKLRNGEVREPDRIGSFILGTARWMATDDRRRERRGAAVQHAFAQQQNPSVEAKEPLDRQLLQRALARLSERERTILVLTFAQSQSAREIADTLQVGVSNVRVIRHRAVVRLAKLMAVDELDETTRAS